MNRERWKQFSDEVDAHNAIEWEEHRVKEERHREKEREDNKRLYEELLASHEKMQELFGMSLPTPFYRPFFSYSLFLSSVAKSEVNFWEWQVGKLTLRTLLK